MSRLDYSYPKRLLLMHKAFGKVPERKCAECKHFVLFAQSRTVWKCHMNRVNDSPSTDWRPMWPACGKFERRGE